MATHKQKQAFDKFVENHGNISRTMREVGYSDNSARNPKNLTESDGWKELMEEHLPDSLLAQRHKELLNKKEVITVFNHASGERESEITEFPDTQAVSKGLDMAYKLKKKYPPVQIGGDPDNPLILQIPKEVASAFDINENTNSEASRGDTEQEPI